MNRTQSVACALFAGMVVGLSAGGSALGSGLPLRKIEVTPGRIQLLTAEQINQLSLRNHLLGKCGGFFDLTDVPRASQRRMAIVPMINFDQRRIQEQNLVRAYLQRIDIGRIGDFVRSYSTFLPNRFAKSQQGLAASQKIQQTLESVVNKHPDWKVESIAHTGFIQKSVKVTIPGRSLKDQIVILGAHLDSINGLQSKTPPFESMIAPGADDNASGVAVMIEALKVLADSGFSPERTVEFMFYAGEELGLIGSQQIAADYQQKNINVIAALQYDMTMFTGPARTITFVSDYVSPPLTRFTAGLVQEYVGLRFNETPCGHACSDHASWNRIGVPSVYPFESVSDGVNMSIHTERDRVEGLDFEFGSRYARLALAFAVELAMHP